MTPEGKTKREIKKLLNSLEPPCWQYWPVPMGMGVATVDVLLCWRGVFYAIEAKRADGKGRLTGRQEDTLRDIVAAGGGVCVEDRLDCANVKRMLGLA